MEFSACKRADLVDRGPQSPGADVDRSLPVIATGVWCSSHPSPNRNHARSCLSVEIEVFVALSGRARITIRWERETLKWYEYARLLRDHGLTATAEELKALPYLT